MADLILVQPKVGVFDSSKKYVSPPFGLLSAARNVARSFQMVIIDQRTDKHWRRRLSAELKLRPRLVGITAITGGQIRYALEITKVSKSLAPQTPVCWGGIHASMLPEQTLEHPLIDMVIRNEGEETLLEVLQVLKQGGSLSSIQGLSYKENGKIYHNDDRPFVELDALPVLPYSLIETPGHFNIHGRKAFYLETSRGCPNACSYCYNSIHTRHRWRALSPFRVEEHIRELGRSLPQVNHLYIVDDNYFVDLERALELAGRLERLPYTYQLIGVEIPSLLKLTDSQMRLLAKSGLIRVDMGAESGSERILTQVGKCIRVKDILEANRKCRCFGIIPWFNFMLGFPEETPEEMEATINLILCILNDNPQALISPIYGVTPYPGTKLFEQSRSGLFTVPQSLEGWIEHCWQRPSLHNGLNNRQAEILNFLSVFIDGKIDSYQARWGYKFLARLYRPLARWRMSMGFYRMIPELLLWRRFYQEGG